MSEIVRELASITALTEVQVRKIIASAPIRYKIYQIKKRNGGLRTIAQPAREVKILQRAFMDRFLKDLPIHPSATAYKKGATLRDNVSPHAHNGPIIKMDLRDFFPSIKKSDWVSYCQETNFLNTQEDINLAAALLFHRPKGSRILRLAIGAPSSPMVSNLIMFNFDLQVSQAVGRDYVTYTRYADDITFSARRTGYLTGVIKRVAAIIRSIHYPKLEINSDKTTYVTKKFRRVVTGLTISADGKVTIGRQKKRLLHASIFNALTNFPNKQALQSLAGTLAFVNGVEPEFLNTLRNKYGSKIISDIQTQAGMLIHSDE